MDRLTSRDRNRLNQTASSKLKGWLKTATKMFMVSLLGLQTFAASPAVAATTKPTVKLVGEEPITSGATLKHYQWSSVRGGKPAKARARVISVDLHNPHVKLDVMTGVRGKLTTKQPVLGMTRETEAVAGVNGDFFSTAGEGVAIGPEIRSGELITSPSEIKGMYAFGITNQNKPVIDTFGFQGNITAEDGTSFPLAGINQTYYWTEPDRRHSHANAMYIYTNSWGSASRANDGSTTPTEVLVKNDVVMQISQGKGLAQTPPEDGYILRTHGKAAEFVKEHLAEGTKISADYQLVPTHSNTDPSTYKMLIGGHTILVDQGKPTSYSRDLSSIGGNRSRTGIGYSEDGRRVYMITVDRAGESEGMSVGEFRDFMIQIGVWKGLMLDGGGSTQLAVRPLGSEQTKLTNQTEFGNQRAVVNGLGVYTIAPKGSLKGMIISGDPILFIDQKAQFNLRAYDEYYNPIEVDPASVSWSASDQIGRFYQNIFVPQQAGKGTITAKSGSAQREHQVDIIGFDRIKEMTIDDSAAGYMLSSGVEFEFPVQIVTSTGTKLQVPAESIKWEFNGFDAAAEDDKIIVKSVDSEREWGQAIANYDGFRTMLALPTGTTKKWADFEEEILPITFAGYPSHVKGSAKQVFGLPGEDPDNHVLLINYDFSKGEETKAAYAVFNGEEGMALAGEPKQMSMRIKGDNSLNWIRAEFEDSEGKNHRVDITQNMNWNGWKNFNIDLDQYNMSYPVKFKRLYIANPEQYQDEREVYGAVAFDDIYFHYEREPVTQTRPKIKLTVDQTKMEVNEQTETLDQAPVVIKGTTLVPLRFVVDALGGEVSWDNEAKRVGMIKDEQIADLWIGETEAIVGGKRIETRIAPRLINQRTMVPLRLISEQFGWKVVWNQEEKTITLE